MSKHRHAASFNPDHADRLAPTPALFKNIHAPCGSCGSTFLGERYVFFPSSLFIYGRCPKCGPAMAMLAPDVTEPAEVRRGPVLLPTEREQLDEFFAYLVGDADRNEDVCLFCGGAPHPGVRCGLGEEEKPGTQLDTSAA